MAYPEFSSRQGVIQGLRPAPNHCCRQILFLRTDEELVRFFVGPDTLIPGNQRLRPRMQVTVFYDPEAETDAETALPTAIVLAPTVPGQQLTLAFFDAGLLSEDQSLQLTPDHSTRILTPNGQVYGCSPGNNLLLVYYRNTTRSLPPQTVPEKILVLC